MKKPFEGVVLYPTTIFKEETQSKSLLNRRGTMIGAWVRQDIAPEQRRKLMELNLSFGPGHIGVRSSAGGTVIKFVGQVKNPESAHAIANALRREVKAVLGVHLVLQHAPNFCSISRALAV